MPIAAPNASGKNDAPALKLTGASFGYSGAVVVHAVDITVQHGEALVILGHNGSGKSTLVRGALGLVEQLGGTVEVLGAASNRLRHRHHIGYVPQRHTVAGPIAATVTEVVSSGALAAHTFRPWLSKADRIIVSQAIDSVGLGEYAHAPVSALSGGQQRRVLIARALACRPEILLLDEPTAGIDTASQRGLIATLADICTSGVTVLIVSHEVAPLASVVNRAIVMDQGHKTYDGPLTDEMLHHHDTVLGLHDHPHHHDDHSMTDPADRICESRLFPGGSLGA